MIALILCTALAEPPRGEVVAAWSGNATQGYSEITALPAVARADDASLKLRGSVTHVYYRYVEERRPRYLDSLGVSLGLAFHYQGGRASFGLAPSLEVRWTARGEAEDSERKMGVGGSLTPSVAWQPGRRDVLSATATFATATQYLWAQAGMRHQTIPARDRSTAWSLWLGPDAIAFGNRDARGIGGTGVVELRSRDLHGTLSTHAGVTFSDNDGRMAPMGIMGAAAYWSY